MCLLYHHPTLAGQGLAPPPRIRDVQQVRRRPPGRAAAPDVAGRGRDIRVPGELRRSLTHCDALSARHGGVAVCSPIAPFAETREQVQQMVEDAGGAFFLVHVATPLEECERRDRKGLYAKARAGEIPEFTGISSPYEEPVDPAVRVDTTGRSIEDALDDVLLALDEAGFLHLGQAGDAGA